MLLEAETSAFHKLRDPRGNTKLRLSNDTSFAGVPEVNGYAETPYHGKAVIWQADGGSFGPFRYVVECDADGVVGYWDYGSSVVTQDGETFALIT